MELIDRLLDFLNLQKITKLQIARELHISEPTVHRWFKTFKIPIKAIKYLVDNYKLNPIWYFTGNGSLVLSEGSFVDEKAMVEIKEENLMLRGEVRSLEKQQLGNNIQMIKILKTLTEGVTELSDKINYNENGTQNIADQMVQIYPQEKN